MGKVFWVWLGVLYLEFGGLWRLHAVDATRVHLTSMRVVSFPSLGPFGPRRDRDRRSSRDAVRTGSLKDQRPPTSIIPGDESRRWREGAATLQNAEIAPVHDPLKLAARVRRVVARLSRD